MAEHVLSLDLGTVWDPNVEDYVLLSDGRGRTVLALEHHSDDPDRRVVLLEWERVIFASLGDVNDEARSGHRLYGKGLRGVSWIGIVEHSELVASLERSNAAHPRHDPARFASQVHYVLPLKGDVVEVVAQRIHVNRPEGDRFSAAVSAMR